MNINESEIAFCSVGFGSRYVPMLDRLVESLNTIHPNSKKYIYRNSYPLNSKTHEESMYGFKVHSVQEALNDGYTKIVWLDAACILIKDIRRIFEHCNTHGILAIQDDNLLGKYASNRSLEHFSLSREEAYNKKYHFAGGSFYAFDFNVKLCRDIFNTWKEAESLGLFGSTKEEAAGKLQGHRHDETCFGLSLYKHGSTFCDRIKCGYECCDGDCPEKIIIKKHFK